MTVKPIPSLLICVLTAYQASYTSHHVVCFFLHTNFVRLPSYLPFPSSSSFGFSLFGFATAQKYFPFDSINFVSLLSSNLFHVFSRQIYLPSSRLSSFLSIWHRHLHYAFSHVADVLPSSILAMLGIISTTLCKTSCPSSIPLSITPILNLFFNFGSFNYNRFIFFTDFSAFLHFVQMIIALTTILCCLATLSPTITFVSITSLILRLLTIT